MNKKNSIDKLKVLPHEYAKLQTEETLKLVTQIKIPPGYRKAGEKKGKQDGR